MNTYPSKDSVHNIIKTMMTQIKWVTTYSFLFILSLEKAKCKILRKIARKIPDFRFLHQLSFMSAYRIVPS